MKQAKAKMLEPKLRHGRVGQTLWLRPGASGTIVHKQEASFLTGDGARFLDARP